MKHLKTLTHWKHFIEKETFFITLYPVFCSIDFRLQYKIAVFETHCQFVIVVF